MQKKLTYIEQQRLEKLCEGRAGRGRDGTKGKGRSPLAVNLTPYGLALTIKGVIEGDYFHKEVLYERDYFTAKQYYQLIKQEPNSMALETDIFYRVIGTEHSLTDPKVGEHYYPVGTIVEKVDVSRYSGAFDCRDVDDFEDDFFVHPNDLQVLNIKREGENLLINWANEGGFIAKPLEKRKLSTRTQIVSYELFEVPIYGGAEQFIKKYYLLTELIAFCDTQA
jgi:hypothetical protein